MTSFELLNILDGVIPMSSKMKKHHISIIKRYMSFKERNLSDSKWLRIKIDFLNNIRTVDTTWLFMIISEINGDEIDKINIKINKEEII